MAVVPSPIVEQRTVVPSVNGTSKHEISDSSEPANESDAQIASGTNASRPHTKRARKAINCVPCRTSKLKCDKARPCSSCVLRETTSQCYSDGRDEKLRRNPHNEIASIRHSLAMLEAYVICGSKSSNSSSSVQPSAPTRESVSGKSAPKQEPSAEVYTVPGILHEKGRGSFYSGPTSTATLLYSIGTISEPLQSSMLEDVDYRELTEPSDFACDSDAEDVPTNVTRGYDDDLLAQLPEILVIDGLIDYYLNFCNWMYRHVHPLSLSAAWDQFKAFASADRRMLATLSAVIAVSMRYLPEGHGLLNAFPEESREDIGERFYAVSCEALARYRAECSLLSLELVELLLIQTHYLTLSEVESEEVWKIRGELVSIGTAIGLHRDPDRWSMPRELAERRRWAWWHIILLDRWQCFLFGRPLSIAAHHFDTRIPYYVDPKVDKSGRLFYPNIYMFKLSEILGDIIDNAVSCRPASYLRVVELDNMLQAWLEELPSELALDEHRLAHSLASTNPSELRLGVLSVIIRTTFHHIRLTLHRSYATSTNNRRSPSSSTKNTATPAKDTAKEQKISQEQYMCAAQSLDTASSAADKLIQLVWQGQPETAGSTQTMKSWLGCHMYWNPFHCFSAAMFLSLQLVVDPHQPSASLFRANIHRVLELLNRSRGVPIADKARDILFALCPLYDPGVMDDEDEAGAGTGESIPSEARREQAFALIKSLAFPSLDSPVSSSSGTRSGAHSRGISPRSDGSSPQGTPHGLRPLANPSSSPTSAFALGMVGVSPLVLPHGHAGTGLTPTPVPVPAPAPAPPYFRMAAAHRAAAASSSDGGAISFVARTPLTAPSTAEYLNNNNGSSTLSVPQSKTAATFSTAATAAGFPVPVGDSVALAAGGGGSDGSSSMDDVSMWGAPVGFRQEEWARFFDVVHRAGESKLIDS